MNEDEFIDFFFKEVETLMDAISDSDHVSMLNHASLILAMTPSETKKRLPQVNKLLAKVNKVLTYEPNMRVLKLMQKITKEVDTGIEYYDVDISTDMRLYYKQNLEKEMTTFAHEIRRVIAEVIKDQTQNIINI